MTSLGDHLGGIFSVISTPVFETLKATYQGCIYLIKNTVIL